MDLQKDEDFEKAWQENRHIWESTKNLAKAMFYAGRAKTQAVPDGFVVVPKEPNKQLKNVLSHYLDELCRGGYGCDLDGFVSVNGIDSDQVWKMVVNTKAMIEAQEPAND